MICQKCKQERPVDDFQRATRRVKICRACSDEKRGRNIETRNLKRVVSYFGKPECEMCGWSGNIGVLEFHNLGAGGDVGAKDLQKKNLPPMSALKLRTSVLVCPTCHKSAHLGLVREITRYLGRTIQVPIEFGLDDLFQVSICIQNGFTAEQIGKYMGGWNEQVVEEAKKAIEKARKRAV